MSNTDEDYAFNNVGISNFFMRFRNSPTSPWDTPITFTQAYESVSGRKFKVGGVTPNFAIARKFGRLRENLYTYSLTEYHSLYGTYHYINDTSELRIQGQFSPAYEPVTHLLPVNPLLKINLDNKVSQKVLEKVKEMSVNLATLAAESNKTVPMVVAKAAAVLKAYRQARSGNFKAAAETLAGFSGKRSTRKKVANSWLGLQYGWLPLLNDIFGICVEMQKRRGKGEYRTFKSKDDLTDKATEQVEDTYKRDVTVKTIKYTAIALIKCSRNDTNFQTLQAVGVTNPLQVAWELVPFSFVVDWLVPITTFLGQFDASVGWTYLDGSLTSIIEQESITTRSSSNPAGFSTHYWNATSRNKSFIFKRGTVTSFAGFWTIPYVKNPVSAVHVANLLALIQTSKR